MRKLNLTELFFLQHKHETVRYYSNSSTFELKIARMYKLGKIFKMHMINLRNIQDNSTGSVLGREVFPKFQRGKKAFQDKY